VVRVVYLGDEVTAAGYRLAGAEVYAPNAAEAADAIRQACNGDAELVLVSTELAGALPADELRALQLGEQPLFVLLPAVFGGTPAADLVHEVRGALGIEP
jgi:vacuolar-type H+-ATPase subunit F/Vma7